LTKSNNNKDTLKVEMWIKCKNDKRIEALNGFISSAGFLRALY